MIRKIIFFILLFHFAPNCQAQTRTIDSLKQILATGKQDTTRSSALLRLGNLYLYAKPDTAMLLAKEGLNLASQIGFFKGEIGGLNLMANAFWNIGNYPQALAFYLTALKKSESSKDTKGLTLILSNIGMLYISLQDYKKSLHYSYQALALAEQKRDTAAQATLVLNIGFTYEKLEQLDSARLFAQRAYDLALAVHDTVIISFAQSNMGNIYAKMNEPIIAMEFYRSSLPMMKKENVNYAISETYLEMANVFKQTFHPDSALHYANLAVEAAKKGGYTDGILLASKFLAHHYKSLNKHDSASFYFQESLMAKDSLFSQERNRQLENLSSDEMLRQQEISALKAAAVTERQNNLEYAIIVMGIICFAVLLILLSRSVNINEKWVEFLGVLGLLVFFEFINLFIHPYLADVTNHSPGGMLLVMVGIAALLIPLHHRIERWINYKIIIKNRAHRLSIAKKIVEKLEKGSE